MPTFIVDGKRYKVSVVSPFTRQPSHSDWLAYKASKEAQAELKAERSRKPVISNCEPWSTKEDRLLMKLLTFRTSWSRIADAMDRPAEELQRRWQFLRDGMPRQRDDKVKPTKRVSFAEPLVTSGDPGKVKDQLTAKENALLRKIAAKWEQDRWFAIITRFNKKTGRHITPEDAQTIISG